MGETTCKMKQEETRWNFIKIRIPNIIFIEICNKNTWYSFLIKNFFSDKYHHSMIIDTKYQYRIQLDECCLNGLRIICYVLVVSHAGQDSGLYCTLHSTLYTLFYTLHYTTLYTTLYTLHSTLYTLLYTAQYSPRQTSM